VVGRGMLCVVPALMKQLEVVIARPTTCLPWWSAIQRVAPEGLPADPGCFDRARVRLEEWRGSGRPTFVFCELAQEVWLIGSEAPAPAPAQGQGQGQNLGSPEAVATANHVVRCTGHFVLASLRNRSPACPASRQVPSSQHSTESWRPFLAHMREFVDSATLMEGPVLAR
jgi:hypothetical protein